MFEIVNRKTYQRYVCTEEVIGSYCAGAPVLRWTVETCDGEFVEVFFTMTSFLRKYYIDLSTVEEVIVIKDASEWIFFQRRSGYNGAYDYS